MAEITEQMMRERFKEAFLLKEKIYQGSEGKRTERDAIQAQIAPLEQQLRALNAEIQQLEAPAYDLSNELGRLARALSGQTGDPRE